MEDKESLRLYSNHDQVESIHLIVFRLGSEEFGVPIDQVKEITVTPKITRMPRTPEHIAGVANIRGDIIALVDLEKKFVITPDNVADNVDPKTYTLVLDKSEYRIGILVKDVPHSLTLPLDNLDRNSSVFNDFNLMERYIYGLARYEGKLIIVVDLNKILSSEDLTTEQKINE
jgi:purine-binding chemotaxis protein CheW